MDVMAARRQILLNEPHIATATGAIATCVTDMRGLAKECLVQINPVQSGTGDPAPDNVRPISGWTGVTGYRTGANVWDEEWESGKFDTVTGENIADSNAIRTKNYVPVVPRAGYRGTKTNPEKAVWAMFFDKDKNIITSGLPSTSTANYCRRINDVSFSMPSNCYYVKFYFASYGSAYHNDFSLNRPSTDTSYHAYSGTTIPVTFPVEVGTIYGGTLDVVSGVLVVEYGMVDLGTLTWTLEYNGENSQLFAVYSGYPDNMKFLGKCVCSCFLGVQKQTNSMNANEIAITNSQAYYIPRVKTSAGAYASAGAFKTAMAGQKLVYELYSPITYHLTPQQITLLAGTNNVWADTGDTSVKFWKH